ncbi:hypothetical protein H4J59_04025, partial [Colwellia sp. MB02u-10]|uniref:hypothetical protein n=1 Tax=Colwellia sp. MB02u-10 TaxID=2759828 RepID=UPI0015F78561
DGTVTVLANAPLATDTTITATLTVGYGDPVTASFVVTAIAPQLKSFVLSPATNSIPKGMTLVPTISDEKLSNDADTDVLLTE